MRIAHFSDLHLMALEGLRPWRLANKRITGWVNLKLKRGHIHRPEAARAVAHAVREGAFDHVVVTGDFTNLALEQEFEAARAFLDDELGLPPERVSVVPGNHDRYTRGAERSQRFEHFFGPYLAGDLADASGIPDAGPFPYVRLRGPIAIVGLSSAVARLPLFATGRLGKGQRMALRSVLAHAEVRARLPVLLQHHPWHQPPTRHKRWLQGMSDWAAERDALAEVERGLLLHGHMHRRVHRSLETARGRIDAIGATSASLVTGGPACVAGYNIYEIEGGVLVNVAAMRYDPASGGFEAADVPRA